MSVGLQLYDDKGNVIFDADTTKPLRWETTIPNITVTIGGASINQTNTLLRTWELTNIRVTIPKISYRALIYFSSFGMLQSAPLEATTFSIGKTYMYAAPNSARDQILAAAQSAPIILRY